MSQDPEKPEFHPSPKRKRDPVTRELPPNRKKSSNTVPLPADTVTFSTTIDTTTDSVAAARTTTTKEQVPGTVTTSTTGALQKLAPLRPLTTLSTTVLSRSLIPQTKDSAVFKTCVSPASGPQGLLPLTVPAITTLVLQVQAKLSTLAFPAHETFLSGAPTQANVPPLAETAQQALAVPKTTMPPPVLGTCTTAGHLPPGNVLLTGLTREMLTQSKQIELQLINVQIEKHKITFKLRE